MPGSYILPLILALPILGAIFVMCTPKAEGSLHRGETIRRGRVPDRERPAALAPPPFTG